MQSGIDFFFFFQAEDGIRDRTVTGVQTCALPIYGTNVIPPTVTAGGLVGGAFDFNGSNYVRVPDSAELKPNQLTVEAWVYPTLQTVPPQAIIARGSSSNDADAWWLGLQFGRPRFGSLHLGSGTHLLDTFVSLPLNK